MDKKSALILMGELIGEKVKITKSVRKELIGVEGTIIDETLNTFVIEKAKKEIVVPKKLCTFKVSGQEVEGKDLLFRPEDRIKKYWRKFDGTMRR